MLEGVLLKPLPYAHPVGLASIGHSAKGIWPHSCIPPIANKTAPRAISACGTSSRRASLAWPNPNRSMSFWLPARSCHYWVFHPRWDAGFPRETTAPALARRAVLMYGYWQSRFGGDRSVIGRGLYRRQPVAGDGNHRNGAADRLRQRGQPAAGASRCPPAGTGHPQRSGRRLADDCLQT